MTNAQRGRDGFVNRARMEGRRRRPTAGSNRFRPRVETLEDRTLLSAGLQEQYDLYLLNRMRTDPADELPLLVNSTDPDIRNAFSFWGISTQTLAQQWTSEYTQKRALLIIIGVLDQNFRHQLRRIHQHHIEPPKRSPADARDLRAQLFQHSDTVDKDGANGLVEVHSIPAPLYIIWH